MQIQVIYNSHFQGLEGFMVGKVPSQKIQSIVVQHFMSILCFEFLQLVFWRLQLTSYCSFNILMAHLQPFLRADICIISNCHLIDMSVANIKRHCIVSPLHYVRIRSHVPLVPVKEISDLLSEGNHVTLEMGQYGRVFFILIT